MHSRNMMIIKIMTVKQAFINDCSVPIADCHGMGLERLVSEVKRPTD